jgi:hypothetical protein
MTVRHGTIDKAGLPHEGLEVAFSPHVLACKPKAAREATIVTFLSRFNTLSMKTTMQPEPRSSFTRGQQHNHIACVDA